MMLGSNCSPCCGPCAAIAGRMPGQIEITRLQYRQNGFDFFSQQDRCNDGSPLYSWQPFKGFFAQLAEATTDTLTEVSGQPLQDAIAAIRGISPFITAASGKLYQKEYPFNANGPGLTNGSIVIGVFCAVYAGDPIPLILQSYVVGPYITPLESTGFAIQGWLFDGTIDRPRVVDDTNPPLQADPILASFSQIESAQRIDITTLRNPSPGVTLCRRGVSGRIVWAGLNPLP